MTNFQALECDLTAAGDGLYRVIRVRYHVRPRRFTTRDDLFGVSVFVEPTA